MSMGRSAILAIVGTGCIAAAGIGGYLAVRTTVPGAAAQAVATDPAGSETPPSPAAVDAQPVASAVAAENLPVAPAASARPAPAASRPAPVVERPPTPVVAEPSVPSADSVPARTDAVVPEPVVPMVSLPAPPSRFVAVTLEENTVIGIRLDRAVSSETAQIEDRVTGQVTREVMVDGRLAIPAGAELRGYVTEVRRGGAFRERARLGVRFDTLLLPDGTRMEIVTDAIYRDGEPPAGEATTKIGAGAAVGAVIGAIIGGGKGAAIGGSAGAAGGTAAVAAGGANPAVLSAGASLTVELTEPVTLLVERVRE